MKREYWEIMQAMPAAELRRLVQQAEQSGIGGIWAPQLHEPPFPTLGAIAMASERVKIGTGIALAFTRSPLETALNAIALDRLSGGRLVLGLGTSVRAFNERNHGVVYGKPVAHLREVVLAVREIIEKAHTGELGVLEGEYHRLDLRGFRSFGRPTRKSIPIYVPALFANTVAMAAEVADGMLGHPVWSARWIAEQSQSLAAKLSERGRSREQFHVNLWNYVAVANNRKDAVDDMRGTVAFYSSIAQYEKYFAAHGFGEQARAASKAAAGGDTAAMLRAVPDEMVTTFAIAGTPDEVRGRVADLWRHADSLTLSPPQHFVDSRKVAEHRSAIGSMFYQE